MKTWQFNGTNQALTLNELPEKHAGPGEVVVEVKAAGVCHSDVTAIDDPGWMPLFPELPRTMGHVRPYRPTGAWGSPYASTTASSSPASATGGASRSRTPPSRPGCA